MHSSRYAPSTDHSLRHEPRELLRVGRAGRSGRGRRHAQRRRLLISEARGARRRRKARAQRRGKRVTGISETQIAQDALLRDASQRSLEIEGEYAAKLKAFLQQLDASKAGNLAALEKDLNFRQEQLLGNARDEMDAIHAAATSAKIRAMNEADRGQMSNSCTVSPPVAA